MIHELDVESCPKTKRAKLELKNEEEWELILERHDFIMWRRPLDGHAYLSEYKCAGTYRDISAASFFVAQVGGVRKSLNKLHILHQHISKKLTRLALCILCLLNSQPNIIMI